MAVLTIQGFNQHAADGMGGIGNIMKFQAIEYYTQPSLTYIFVYGVSDDPGATPLPTFISDDTAFDYYKTLAGPSLITTINTAIGTSFYTTYDAEKVAPPVLALLEDYVLESALATVATTGSYTDLTNQPTIPTVNTPSYTTPSRTINSAFQISSTREADVTYSVDISCAITLGVGQKGTVFLRYADDSGFTTNVKTINQGSNSSSGLTALLSLSQLGTVTLHGRIPAGKYVKIVSQNDTGTPTFTLNSSQQEVLL